MSKVYQFFKNRYMVSKQDHIAEDYQHSDLGRMYGWWVLVNGKRVASLEYRSFLEELVHLYEVLVLDPDFSQIEQDPERWASQDVVIESRYAENYSKKGLEMAPVGKGMIVVQDLFVPESYYGQQHSNIGLFHDELLRNAEQSRMQNKKAEIEATTSNDEPDASSSNLSASAEATADPSSEESDHMDDSSLDAASSSRDKKRLEKQLRTEKKQQKRQELQIEREKLKAEKREKRRLEKEKQAVEPQRRLQLEQQKLAQEREQLALLEKEKLSRERLEQEAETIRKAEELLAAENHPFPPSSSIDKEAAWQNKLGGIPRQPRASQNTAQKANDDSITEV